MIQINDNLQIPDSEYSIQFTRSSGPGGQNVNKVNSKVILSWKILESVILAPSAKKRFIDKYANKINQEGCLVVSGERFRDQPMNIKDCKDKLAEMILGILVPPKKRIATKPSKAAKERRIAGKKNRADIKKNRKKVDF